MVRGNYQSEVDCHYVPDFAKFYKHRVALWIRAWLSGKHPSENGMLRMLNEVWPRDRMRSLKKHQVVPSWKMLVEPRNLPSIESQCFRVLDDVSLVVPPVMFVGL